MPLLKWLKKDDRKGFEGKIGEDDADDEEEQQRRVEEEERDTTRRTNEEGQERQTDGTKFVYFACGTPKDDLIALLQTLNKDFQVS